MNITDNLALQVQVIPNLATGGMIGTAAATVDQSCFFSIAQTTANQNITYPNPTTSGYAYILIVKNTGTVPFTSYGNNIDIGKMVIFSYQNGAWTPPASQQSGNITSVVSNVIPGTILNVGGLFEISMPGSTDVQIRALVARSVYILSEGEYPGGSFSTSTAAIVNLTTAFSNADNGTHVAGERNTITIQDVLTNRLFKVTAWRFGAVTGNWSGWVEEIGITTNTIITTTARASVICRNKTTQSLPASTWTKLVNWTEIKDTTNSFDPVTGIFTAPRTGIYEFSTGNGIAVPATNYYGQCIFLNGTTQLYNVLTQSAGVLTQYPQTNGMIELTAGQTLEARTYNGGLAVNDSVSASNSWFTINEINPTF